MSKRANRYMMGSGRANKLHLVQLDQDKAVFIKAPDEATVELLVGGILQFMNLPPGGYDTTTWDFDGPPGILFFLNGPPLTPNKGET